MNRTPTVIQLFLPDGSASGKVQATIPMWTGILYKFPRRLISEDDVMPVSHANQSGIYFLLNNNQGTGFEKYQVYIGQANVRSDNTGLLQRIREHNNPCDTQFEFWNECIAITTTNNSWGSTELNFLESRFYDIAMQSQQCREVSTRIVEAHNSIHPTRGNVSAPIACICEQTIEKIKWIVRCLGCRAFEPLIPQLTQTPDAHNTLSPQNHETSNVHNIEYPVYRIVISEKNIDAIGIETNDNFIVRENSKISLKFSEKYAVDRKHYGTKMQAKQQELIDENAIEVHGDYGILLRDVALGSANQAACFVQAASGNRHDWKLSE